MQYHKLNDHNSLNNVKLKKWFHLCKLCKLKCTTAACVIPLQFQSDIF